MLKLLKLALIVLSALPCLVMAEAGNAFFIWDNDAGFVATEDCKVEMSEKNDMWAMGVGGFYTDQGVRVNTLDGTLVKILSGRGNRTFGGEAHKAVRVLAAPGEVEMTCDRVAKRGELGFASDKLLHPLNLFEIQIRTLNGVNAEVRESMKHLRGSVWRMATAGESKLTYVCGKAKKRYTVFNLFDSRTSILPVAQLGVWREQTQIFADVDIRRIAIAPEKHAAEGRGTIIEGLNPELNPPPDLTMNEVRRTLGVPLPKDASEPGEKNYAGMRCERGDKDPLKCMICVINFESEFNHYEGMVAVGRTMMERLAHPLYPKDLCKIAHQQGQYVAVWEGRPITKDSQQVAKVTAAAKEAMARGGQGFTGFRSCAYLRGIGNNSGVNIGNNCFLKNGFLQLPTEDSPGTPKGPSKNQFAERLTGPRSS